MLVNGNIYQLEYFKLNEKEDFGARNKVMRSVVCPVSLLLQMLKWSCWSHYLSKKKHQWLNTIMYLAVYGIRLNL